MKIALILLLSLLVGCKLPTEDISNREILTKADIRRAIDSTSVYSELYFLDNRYLSYCREELVQCLDTGKWIGDIGYVSEYHDCDEYAVEMMGWVRSQLQGIPFGLGIGEVHAENIFVDRYLNVWVVDIRIHGSKLNPPNRERYSLILI